jgi:mannosyl-3-phosphoglycerate phosphatase
MSNRPIPDGQPIIYTDLDGTLLDFETYSFEKALRGLKAIKNLDIPLVLCSAKTRAEQEVYREKLEIEDPFIVEDGNAIFVKRGYYPFEFDHHRDDSGYQVIELGRSYGEVRGVLSRVAKESGLTLKGYGDMSIEEVADITGLSRDEAARAKSREYSETLTAENSDESLERLERLLENYGLGLSHGARFHGIMDKACDKGRAVSVLNDLFRKRYGKIITIGIGDSGNDIPMLESVDLPFLVQKLGRKWAEVQIPDLVLVEGIGPEGWNKAILDTIRSMERRV